MAKRIGAWLMLIGALFAGTVVAADSQDDAAIKEVVDRAYVHGVHIDADREDQERHARVVHHVRSKR